MISKILEVNSIQFQKSLNYSKLWRNILEISLYIVKIEKIPHDIIDKIIIESIAI